MSNLKEYKAAPGRVVAFPASVATAPGARTRSVRGDETIELDSKHRFVIRRCKAGDLELVDSKPATKRKDK